ncbi:MAG: DegT/DnrJ/EryC1/StrS family aminotransferase [Desulfovibrio sp.]|nr:MAG: DegT/DnrJ/EryC1/StrS family aminotransferase [Desulfovibrio sp.]
MWSFGPNHLAGNSPSHQDLQHRVLAMNIPFMRLDRQFAAHKDAYMAAVERVFTHGRVLQGPEVGEFEERLASFFGLAGAAAVGSGTDALVLALRAAGLQLGGKVAVTSLSFVASASAIALAGGKPVFVDIEPEHNLNREDVLLELVDKRAVDAVIVVHLYGQMAETQDLRRLARERGVIVIEDAAQALGATRHGNAPGRDAHAVCLSFDPTKVIGAQGSGGMVLSADADLMERVRRLRYHGLDKGHPEGRVYSEIGHNSQLPTVQASLLNVKMDHEAEWRARRTAIASAYTAALDSHPLLTPPQVREGNTHIFHKYVLRAPGIRDDLAAHLKAQGIGTAVHYTKGLHEQPCFADKHELAGDMVEVGRACGEVLSLPIYPELTDGEVGEVCTALGAYTV